MGENQKYKAALRDHLKWIAWKYRCCVQESLNEVKEMNVAGKLEAYSWETYHPVCYG